MVVHVAVVVDRVAEHVNRVVRHRVVLVVVVRV